MADKELIEGLRTALSRGESLEQAMYTFSNAGYEKAKIEEAARALLYQRKPESMPERPVSPQPKTKPKSRIIRESSPMLPAQTKQQLKPQPSPQVSKPMPSPQTLTAKTPLKQYTPPKPVEETKQPSKQIVSGYEKQKTSKKKLTIILLIIFLIILLGGLASIFIFRTEIIEIFNNLL